MLKYVALAFLVACAGVLGVAATRPDTFRIERTLRIDAPASQIFPLVNDLHRHAEWSPWEKKDPSMQRTHSGEPLGRGAVYEWNGNSDIGSGRMEIVDSKEPERVVLKLDFLVPFEAHNTAEFVLVPDGDATNVTWAMYGPQLFLGKVIGVFMDMDAMVGGEFAIGLANLKAATEKPA
jgi:uncharacterized protein YndB with AHSA1/START domain